MRVLIFEKREAPVSSPLWLFSWRYRGIDPKQKVAVLLDQRRDGHLRPLKQLKLKSRRGENHIDSNPKICSQVPLKSLTFKDTRAREDSKKPRRKQCLES